MKAIIMSLQVTCVIIVVFAVTLVNVECSQELGIDKPGESRPCKTGRCGREANNARHRPPSHSQLAQIHYGGFYYDYYDYYAIYDCDYYFCGFYFCYCYYFSYEKGISDEGKLVSGKAEISAYPHMLQLGRNGEQFCVASIISSNWALTAAQCLFEKINQKRSIVTLTLRAGASVRDEGGRLHRVAKGIIHPLFNPTNVDYNLALLNVRERFVYSNRVKPIQIPRASRNMAAGARSYKKIEYKPIEQVPFIVSGFNTIRNKGNTNTNLQHHSVRLVSQHQCEVSYKKSDLLITNRMICAATTEEGKLKEPGSALVRNNTLVAVLSFGPKKRGSKLPDVFTRVDRLAPWIFHVTSL